MPPAASEASALSCAAVVTVVRTSSTPSSASCVPVTVPATVATLTPSPVAKAVSACTV